MKWEPMAAEEKKVYDLLEQSRAVAEESGARLLAASACLDILAAAFRYDLCQELMAVILDYGRRKVQEEDKV